MFESFKSVLALCVPAVARPCLSVLVGRYGPIILEKIERRVKRRRRRRRVRGE